MSTVLWGTLLTARRTGTKIQNIIIHAIRARKLGGSGLLEKFALDCPYPMHLFQPQTIKPTPTQRSLTNETAPGVSPAELKLRRLTWPYLRLRSENFVQILRWLPISRALDLNSRAICASCQVRDWPSLSLGWCECPPFFTYLHSFSSIALFSAALLPSASEQRITHSSDIQ